MTAAIAIEERGIYFPGAGMTLDWVPGAGLAVAGGILSLWRSSVVTQEKVEGLNDEIARVETEIARIESDARQFQRDIHEDLHESFDKMNGLVTEMKVLAAEQGAFNKICTKTLEVLAARVENHDAVMMRNHTDIELLKAQGGGQKA